MHYYGNETIMSITQAIHLKPNEIRVLEWVRTYEYVENTYGVDENVPVFLEIQIIQDGVRVQKNQITDFPDFTCLQMEIHTDIESALRVFKEWADGIINRLKEQGTAIE
ncbi:hypothetical protein ABHN05_00295 [Brevibacillus laterosporus]|uniref:hypothetical protein n=1 Tax=Brevibacillus laterosporus TaxID=1465 RepID=UPI001129F0D9|nr:hypothetical protein [Brevibacillus laterosporus]MBG9803449.1 hypothetical protein [Brevibacillus laterosporus]MED4762760.1 hypothetical protein [Brevibacillus laterosporus]TPH14326.1 hypothetical protein EGH09_13965 [Brevibacillus laterosporus]